MNRSKARLIAASLAGAAVAVAAAPAGGAVRPIEVGQTATPLVAPTCPPAVKPVNCTIILTRVTGLETIRDGVMYPTKVTRAGRIVAFTLGLSRLSSNRTTARREIHSLDLTWGGTTQAALTVLKQSGAARLHRWTVTAQSTIFHLQPYLGQVVTFPLNTTLPVTRGEVIALSVPTWAPVLSINLNPGKFAYRQSRSGGCNTPATVEMAQLRIGDSTRYQCNYTGTRIEYTATEIPTPVPPKDQIRAADRPR